MSKQDLNIALHDQSSMDNYLETTKTQEIINDILEVSNNTTLRDQFAMAALQGLLAISPNGNRLLGNEAASRAYAQADYMIEARE